MQEKNEFAGIDNGVAPKQQRLFIARQACEGCRQRKTRCDGGNPCGTCRGARIECVFGERKATKNEVSLGMIFNALQRIEGKIEEQYVWTSDTDPTATKPAKRRKGIHCGPSSPKDSPWATDDHPYGRDHPRDNISSTSPAQTATSTNSIVLGPHIPVIQYPIRQIATWPAIRTLLRKATSDVQSQTYNATRATLLEQKRPALPPPSISPTITSNWVNQLNISLVKDLCDKFFATWNLANPILDRRLCSQHTLGVAIHSDFGPNIESCLVLVVMALGTLGKKALHEAGFSTLAAVQGSQQQYELGSHDDTLVFFDEARKRIGFTNCDNSVQSCQYYLLSGLVYSHLLRPVDWWTMVNRAAVCCTTFFACPPDDCDQWMMDLQSRLFWNTVMFEAILTQELDLPASGLQDYVDRVPLPKFVDFPGIGSFTALPTTSDDHERDAFCHYHFLSQIAHRIILTRLCDSLFAARNPGASTPAETTTMTLTRSDYPPMALEDELLHQLEQWRHQLPERLQWDDGDVPLPTSPENILVVPWLRARYLIARYHLRRPLLHRALHHPDSMTNVDFEKCHDAFSCVMEWTSIMELTLTMRSCAPLKFFICTQLFGQILIFHALDCSSTPELHSLVPEKYETWCRFALQFLEECAPESPIVAQEHAIAAALLGHEQVLTKT